ncbi:MAG: ABC transporter permease subunit [Firmicutes bacterium]|nr:ABC transporter permease subunit [Bacillota bacterium]
MLPFLRLLRKDLESIRWPLGIISGLSAGLIVFLRFKLAGGWHEDLVGILMAAPLMFLPFWLFWQSFQSLRTEWREDTVYTLLCLPVPGWQLTLSKLCTIAAEYTVYLGVVAAANALFNPFAGEILASFPASWLLRNGFLFYLIGLSQVVSSVIFIQLAFVVSKMVGRLQGLVSLWTFFLAFWVTGRMGGLLEPLFRWIPAVPLHRLFRLDLIGRPIVSYWDAAPKISQGLIIFGFFWLTGYCLENYVEVNG